VTPRGGSESYIDEGIPLIRSLNVYFSGFKFEDLVFISKETHSNMRNSQLRIGDVLLNITGASIGRCYYFSGEFDEANVNQHVCIIRVNSKKIYSKFLYYLLSTKKKQDEIMNLQVGASREGLNYQQIKNFDVPIVDLNKQQEIVDYLDKKTQDIDKIVEKINQSINLLTEYKSSLISHVVTGKVKV
jgi:type I restriction enzyme S subunit